MQSWGLTTNETIPPSDSVPKTKNASFMGFGDLSSEVEAGKMNPFMVNMNTFSDSNSRHSCSAVDSSKRASSSSCIDLKLGRFGDPTETQDSSKGGSVFSVSELSKPAKRVRLGVNFHHSRCQVYGCNKDLTSSKEYHRRHKVCEVHSKTAKVIVNGIEQRFCQQCSRFHLLNEFDDGKRSCRKRLAGHNERRRKPQVGYHSGRTGRLLQSYNGFATSRCKGTSFICEDILPNVPLNLEKSGRNSWYRNIKVESDSDYSLQSPIPITNGQFHSKPVFDCNYLEKAFLGLPVNEELNGLEGLSGITNSGCALSLLSSQSQNISSQLPGISMACPLLVSAGSNNNYIVSQVSEKLLGVGSTSATANHFSSSALISNGGDVINFDVTHEFCQGSNFMNGKDRVSCEDDTTIDLLELSSQLQRVEWQKQSTQVKQETDAMYWRHIT